MIRKIASATTFVTLIIVLLEIIYFEKIPLELTQYIQDMYPSKSYETYLALIGLTSILSSCYLIYNNSKYAVHSIVLTIIFVHIPYLITPGIDVSSNFLTSISEIGDISYGISIGALLIERQKKTKKSTRTSK